jgi:uncharacterized protein (DUF1330 family)
MAKGYWIVRFDVSDMEQYRSYVAANAGPLAEHGARFLVRGGDCELRRHVAVGDFLIIEGYDGPQPEGAQA